MMSKNARFLVGAAVCMLLGSSLSVAAADSVPVLQGMAAEAGSLGPVIHIEASGSLETVHYSPQPGVWVVEMPKVSWEQGIEPLSDLSLGIERAELAAVEEFGRKVSRLTVWLSVPAQMELVTGTNGLDLVFSTSFAEEEPAPVVASESLPVPAVSEETEQVPQQPEPAPRQPAAQLPAQQTADVVVPPPAASLPASGSVSVGGNLLDVTAERSGDGVIIGLKGDGALQGQMFELPDPARLVIDFTGVVNRVDRHVFGVNAALVSRVRVAQFRAVPEPITRIVVDLAASGISRDYVMTADGAQINVGCEKPQRPSVSMEQAATTPAPVAGSVSSTGQMVISNKPESEPVESQPVTDEEPSGIMVISNESGVIEVREEPEDWVAPQTPQAVAWDEHVAVQPSEELEQESSPAEQYYEAPVKVEPETKGSQRSPWVADPTQLIEKAPAGEVLEAPGSGAESFETTEVDSEEKQFSGDPITLTLKDADIADVLKTFSQLTNLNIVQDNVRGSVTVDLRNVPWDQALDLILKVNGLGYVLENNVLRVAPLNKLAAEKQDAAAFIEEQERAKPIKTVVKPVSYARADEVASLLASDSFLLSSRGSVVVDKRTNTLIIRDVIDRVEGILRLIETLDKPTSQVVIEGRIVETTRDFAHTFGLEWGFDGLMDAEHGNTTGLSFPNNGSITGQTNLERGGANGVIGFTFGDILNTFNLDFTLSAAESDGIVKIVSTPRVMTQNLNAASIQSGLQIPIQTQSNNTVTVQYVNATLRMQVTPQITAEGTVLLDLNVQKQEPVLAVGVAGATNAPIFTRDVQTTLLVRDGGTSVIAGIYQINDQDSVDKVPVLHKIPFIGNLFKNKDIFKRHDELLIFITPRIVKY